ncbi:unnamed protein product [Linum trigynum]|uniref:Uncharacterized protein n=1 Tax=Linum trigynum TaxID=586398 RepID=A0AAV2FTM2_9ROSI
MAPINPQLHPAVTFNNKEAVRMFYAILKQGPGSSPSSFTTVVYNHEILVTPSLLAATLDLPYQGSSADTNDDFVELVFDFGSALESLTHDIGRYFPNMLSAGHLADLFKIMANARDGVCLNFSLLMFAHMTKYGDENYSSPLPFGPRITCLLYTVGIDLTDKLIISDVRDDLRAQHIFAHVDAFIGRQKPVIRSGGELSVAIPAKHLEHYKARIKIAKEVEAYGLQEEEADDVSYYESPLQYES